MMCVCAWCKCGLGEVAGGSPGDVTHGICAPCKEGVLKQLDPSLVLPNRPVSLLSCWLRLLCAWRVSFFAWLRRCFA